ncbi:MAG: hypothetical protein GYA33_11885, partial [Thermogutta sp.]|nr:hypothetical protein [Thermogutta sp.]
MRWLTLVLAGAVAFSAAQASGQWSSGFPLGSNQKPKKQTSGLSSLGIPSVGIPSVGIPSVGIPSLRPKQDEKEKDREEQMAANFGGGWIPGLGGAQPTPSNPYWYNGLGGA